MPVSNAHVWRAAQERLRQEMTRAQFDTWLRGTHLDTSVEGEAVLSVRSTFAKEMLERRFHERIEAAVAEVTGRACRMHIEVGGADDEAAPKTVQALAGATAERGALGLAHATTRREAHHQRSDDYERLPLFGAAPTNSDTDNAHNADPTPTDQRVPAPSTAPDGSRGQEPPALPGRGRYRRLPGAHEHTSRTSALYGSRVRRETSEHAGPLAWTPAARGGPATSEGEGSGGSAPQGGVPEHVVHPRQGARDGMASMGVRSDAESDFTEHDALYPHDDKRTPEETRAWTGQSAREKHEKHEAQSHDSASGSENGALAVPFIPPPRLNARYTFSTFIVGSANQLAHAASLAVAEAPGQAYNPLFLYGGVGLGKTHLLHAIGHTAIDRELTVLYVSSETFTNEIINAIRYRTTEEFRAKYRSVDLLLVDDIQFIAGKESTEEEFFHTFNSLYETDKQIVICSDRPPKAIVSLEERLRSRFEWGLIADIQPPDLETRVAILRAKADMMQRHVPDEVLSYLASRVQSNIRELEGSFNRLLAFSELQGMPLSIDTAKSVLASLASDGRQRRVSIADVLEAVAEHYRIPLEDLRGKQRDKHIVGPRQVAMYLMRQETEASLLEIGQALGGRDHSTVMHGCEKIGREVNENTSLRREVLSIRQQLMG